MRPLAIRPLQKITEGSMKNTWCLGAIGLSLALTLNDAWAGPPGAQIVVYERDCAAPVLISPPCPLPPAPQPQPQPEPQPQPQPAPAEAFAQAPPAGTGGAAESFVPNMLGDALGLFQQRFNTSSSSSTTSSSTSSSGRTTLTPISYSKKIAEGESPGPQSRVFFEFNGYQNVDRSLFSREPLLFHNVSYFRYTFGGEKTFGDGDMSVGVRIPINSVDASASPDALTIPTTGFPLGTPPGNFSMAAIGDVSLIFKYVLCRDTATGSLLSAGLDLSFPTGQVSASGVNPEIDSNLIVQPYLGYILKRGDFFLQGFSSIALRTVRTDAMIWFNDVGVGYFVYRSREGALTGVAPTLELHSNVPLYSSSLFTTGLTDVIDVTAGTTFELWNRASLALGVSTPLTAPRPYEYEVIAQLNLRF
jgi:hypothetical protein